MTFIENHHTLVKMSDLELGLIETYKKYVERHAKTPTSFSVSWDFRYQIAEICLPFSTPTYGGTNQNDYFYWRGLPIKLVRRKHYIEALPRKKRNTTKHWVNLHLLDCIGQGGY